MNTKINELLGKMTREQKINLVSGKNFWETKDYPELGIPSVEVADGPYGLRKQLGLCDHMGWNKSVPSTAYVCGPGLAASWDKELAMETGRHLAAEAKANNVDVLLGPAINLVRTPLCGRNFEYYSEDPCLTGKMAAAYIEGVQESGVGTCIKHFAANNQEIDREYIDSVVDERTLRELYLAAFEEPVKTAKPWSVMTALNKVNGDYCSENNRLITEILRDEWGFDGLVMSDWNGVNNRVRAVKAGLDLEMPYSYGVSAKRLADALESGELLEEELDACCERVLQMVFRGVEGREKEAVYKDKDHNAYVHEMAERSIVLLKNEDSILPLSTSANVAVLGEFAVEPRFQMEGSALVNPSRWDIPLDEIKKVASGNITYGKGYSEDAAEQKQLLEEAKILAQEADVAVIFAGLPKGIEAEGKDRKNIQMPDWHNELVAEVAKVQKNVIVVLFNGSPVYMPWLSDVKGVLECFLAGQAMGGAVADILYGATCPSGKLPVSFPMDLRNTPAYLYYPGYNGKVEYQEGIFAGYRYYQTKNIKPQFCFGYGLSYTTFEYSALTLDQREMTDADTVTIRFTVTNTGKVAGSEAVQLYVAPPKQSIPRPSRELRDFAKVFLQPGETKEVSFILGKRGFAYFDEDLADWYVTEGVYRIQIGASVEDIRLEESIQLNPVHPKRREITGWTTIGVLRESKAGCDMFEQIKQILKDSGNEQALKLPIFQEDEEHRERVDQLPLRMITVLSDNVLNNDIMDALIAKCNEIVR